MTGRMTIRSKVLLSVNLHFSYQIIDNEKADRPFFFFFPIIIRKEEGNKRLILWVKLS